LTVAISAEVREKLNEAAASSALDDAACDGLLVDGVKPEAVFRPESVKEVAALLKCANDNGLAVVPWGGGTLMHLGCPPERYDVALKLEALDQIIDYPAEDMTITVQAGMTLGQLQTVLREKGQFLPLDAPNADRATMGGLVATNASGPRRFAEGALRDMVLGMKVVHADGTIVKGGGRVVKNVAGYDLCKLYTGSLGTLGVIAEITFRVRPVPEAAASAWCEFESPDEAEKAIEAILESELTPVFLEYLSGAGAKAIGPAGDSAWAQGRPAVLVGLDSSAEATQWQLEHLREVLGAKQAELILNLDGELNREVCSRVVEFRSPAGTTLIGKANVPSSQVTAFTAQAEDAARDAGLTVEAQSHAANGIVYLRVKDEAPDESQVAVVQKWTSLAQESSGSFVVEHAPVAVKEQIEVWGPPRGDLPLMRSIKETLDPKRTLNPGRFVGKL